jgi:hypothetical protein
MAAAQDRISSSWQAMRSGMGATSNGVKRKATGARRGVFDARQEAVMPPR